MKRSTIQETETGETDLSRLHPLVLKMLKEAENLEGAENAETQLPLNSASAQHLVNLSQHLQLSFAEKIRNGEFRSKEQLCRHIDRYTDERKRRVDVTQKKHPAANRLSKLYQLVLRTDCQFGTYIDMAAGDLNGMIAVASPKQLNAILCTLRVVIQNMQGVAQNMQGLCEAIEHRAARMKTEHDVQKSSEHT